MTEIITITADQIREKYGSAGQIRIAVEKYKSPIDQTPPKNKIEAIKNKKG